MTRPEDAFRRFLAEGTDLAGDLGDFQRRAEAYYQLYRHSHPLIAAHGAPLEVARLSGFDAEETARRLAMVTAFTDTLKDINRQVLVMSYAAYAVQRERNVHGRRACDIAVRLPHVEDELAGYRDAAGSRRASPCRNCVEV